MAFSGKAKGVTLIELLIVMAIFMVVIMISASVFENVTKISSSVTKSAQSQMEGIVGLEILRRDLNAAGYGLPWSFQTPPDPAKYLESDLGADNPVKGVNADDFNDAPPNSSAGLPLPAIPRAVVLGTVPLTQDPVYKGTGKNSNPGSDYLVIKSAVVAFNNSVGKWGYVRYSGNLTANKSYLAKWNSPEDLVANEVVVTHTNTFSGATQTPHVLAMQDPAHFSYKLTTKDATGHYVPAHANYMPSGSLVDRFGTRVNNESMVAYAITSDDTIRMPFNRADYFVMRPTGTSMPPRCCPGTGILYKAVIINTMTSSGGGRTLYPLLDCVGDMQVLFDMRDPVDPNSTMTVDTLATLTAEDIRTRLKGIRVYLLVQEGGKDKKYTYPYTDTNNVIAVSDDRTPSLGHTFRVSDMKSFFGSDWVHYRWKVYSVVGQPYNLIY